jgi:hypothetical protein
MASAFLAFLASFLEYSMMMRLPATVYMIASLMKVMPNTKYVILDAEAEKVAVLYLQRLLLRKVRALRLQFDTQTRGYLCVSKVDE